MGSDLEIVTRANDGAQANHSSPKLLQGYPHLGIAESPNPLENK
jgi:hypothetical protein